MINRAHNPINNPVNSPLCRDFRMRLWPLGCIAALSVRAYRKKQLTPLGVATAIVVASLYSVHPWGALLFMLMAFYVTATSLTKVPETKLPANCSINMILKTDW